MASPDIPCIPNPECKYFSTPEGCFEDRHHIYKQSEATTRTKKEFSRLADHVVHLCRSAHEEWEAQLGWAQYPPVSEMRVVINAARKR